MPKNLLATVLLMLAGTASPAEPPEVVPVQEAASAAEEIPAPEPEGPAATGREDREGSNGNRTDREDASTPAQVDPGFPWNPPVPYANRFPYKKPLATGEPDPAPWGDFWFEAEYLLWGIRGQNTPALVTTGTGPLGGFLNVPGTSVLFGGARLDPSPFSGARLTEAAWLNDCHTLDFEGDYFFLGQRSVRFNAASSGLPGAPLLARPVFNALTGRDDALLIAVPGAIAGSVGISAPTFFQGADGTFAYTVRRDFGYHFDLLGGFRYLQLDDKLNILSTSQGVGAVIPLTVGIMDQFSTRNHFYGGQAGGRGEYCWHGVTLGFKGLLALGYDADVIEINGATGVNIPGFRPLSAPAGLFAQPSNRGRHTDHGFAAVPEVNLRAGWQVQEQVQFFVGFTFLYWSDVVRAGDQIDTTVNPLQGPNGPLFGPARPAFVPRQEAFWAYGLDAGLQIRY